MISIFLLLPVLLLLQIITVMNTRPNYNYNPSPSIFNKLAGLFDKALDLESVIEHPSPYPRIAKRKSYRQLRDSYSPDYTMSDSKYYSTRLIAPNGYGAAPSPSPSYGSSSYYGSPSPAYQAYGAPSSPYQTYYSPISYSAPRAPTPPPIEYCCLMPGCNYAGTRKADLERHYRAVHPSSSDKKLDCDWPGCHRRGNYGFVRKDKLVDHMREVHKADIPKKNTSSRTTSRRPTETVVTTRVYRPDDYPVVYSYSR